MERKYISVTDFTTVLKRIFYAEDMLKNVAQLVHSRHRSVHNFLMNLLAAVGAYCFFAAKPQVNFDYEVPESNGQLVIWQ